MPKAVFVLNDRSEREIEVARYESLMRAAVRNNIDGIAGECGGGLTCATCHVYVEQEWTDRLPPPGPGEDDMLQFTASERRPNSRLSCQLRMSEEMQRAAFSFEAFVRHFCRVEAPGKEEDLFAGLR